MHVFISYSQKDKKRREQVAELLKANNLVPWFDDKHIETGDPLTDVIFPAIDESRCMLVIHTKHSSGSEWVIKEINYARSKAIPILIISFGQKKLPEKFPEELKDIKRIVVNRQFTTQKKQDLVQYVSRYYNRKQAPIVTLLNIKGGVGKTALSANLFGCMHEDKRKSVLLIDLDPQHNLTQLLLDIQRMAAAHASGANVMAMFRGFGQPSLNNNVGLTNSDIERAFSRCKYALKKNTNNGIVIDLIPGSFELVTYFLGQRHQHFDPHDMSWRNFRAFIDYCRSHYDVIVIDVNPGASLMTEVALSVSTHILSPIRPDRFSRYGIGLLHRMLERLDVPKNRIRLLAIMNGIKRSEVDDIEMDLRNNDQPEWSYTQKILKSRIAYSKLLEAKPSIPTADDLTKNLAYQPRFGGLAIRNDLKQASEELIRELGL